MLKIANLSENLLILMGIAEENKMVSSNRFSKTNNNFSKSQKLKNSTVLFNIDTNIKDTRFLNFKASIGFTQLKQVFTKATIFQHFDLKYYIRIKTDVSGYLIGGVLSQLILNSGQ